METIYKGCLYDDIYIVSDVAISSAVLYNVATNTQVSVTLNQRANTTYTYDLSVSAATTKTMAEGIYNLELHDASSRMIDCAEGSFRVVPSSKQNANG